MQLFHKILNGMANIVDPDQTAPSGAVWSGLLLFAYVILSETLVYKILGHLPYSLYLLGTIEIDKPEPDQSTSSLFIQHLLDTWSDNNQMDPFYPFTPECLKKTLLSSNYDVSCFEKGRQ